MYAASNAVRFGAATRQEVGLGRSFLQDVCLPVRQRRAPLVAGKLGWAGGRTIGAGIKPGGRFKGMPATGAAGTGGTTCLVMGCGSGFRGSASWSQLALSARATFHASLVFG